MLGLLPLSIVAHMYGYLDHTSVLRGVIMASKYTQCAIKQPGMLWNLNLGKKVYLSWPLIAQSLLKQRGNNSVSASSSHQNLMIPVHSLNLTNYLYLDEKVFFDMSRQLVGPALQSFEWELCQSQSHQNPWQDTTPMITWFSRWSAAGHLRLTKFRVPHYLDDGTTTLALTDVRELEVKARGMTSFGSWIQQRYNDQKLKQLVLHVGHIGSDMSITTRTKQCLLSQLKTFHIVRFAKGAVHVDALLECLNNVIDSGAKLENLKLPPIAEFHFSSWLASRTAPLQHLETLNCAFHTSILTPTHFPKIKNLTIEAHLVIPKYFSMLTTLERLHLSRLTLLSNTHMEFVDILDKLPNLLEFIVDSIWAREHDPGEEEEQELKQHCLTTTTRRMMMLQKLSVNHSFHGTKMYTRLIQTVPTLRECYLKLDENYSTISLLCQMMTHWNQLEQLTIRLDRISNPEVWETWDDRKMMCATRKWLKKSLIRVIAVHAPCRNRAVTSCAATTWKLLLSGLDMPNLKTVEMSELYTDDLDHHHDLQTRLVVNDNLKHIQSIVLRTATCSISQVDDAVIQELETRGSVYTRKQLYTKRHFKKMDWISWIARSFTAKDSSSLRVLELKGNQDSLTTNYTTNALGTAVELFSHCVHLQSCLVQPGSWMQVWWDDAAVAHLITVAATRVKVLSIYHWRASAESLFHLVTECSELVQLHWQDDSIEAFHTLRVLCTITKLPQVRTVLIHTDKHYKTLQKLCVPHTEECLIRFAPTTCFHTTPCSC